MKLDLTGLWNVKLDPENRGVNEQWYARPLQLEGQVMLPGTLTESGLGAIPHLKTEWTGSIYDRSWFHDPELERFRSSKPPHFPFWLTPLRRYVGAAWYEKEIEVPEDCAGQAFVVELERPHWVSELWIDGEKLGRCESLSTVHRFEHPGLSSAGTHRLTLRVDNAIREIHPGQDAHSISDHTQGNWNGVVGRMELTLLSDVEIHSVQLLPDWKRQCLRIRGLLSGSHAIRGNLSVELHPSADSEDPSPRWVQTCVATQSIYHRFEMELSLAGLQAWDEFHPVLHELRIHFLTSDGSESVWKESHGFRDYSVCRTRFMVNDRTIFLRGNVDCCVFPLTGYPPMDVLAWRKYFERLHEQGFNHVRFHSWCPPKAAFVAADELGFYLQVEAPTWPNHGVSIGEGEPIDGFIYRETERILEQYGNHASLCMVASGNEPYGDRQVEFLTEYVQHFRERDARQLYTGASVGTHWPIVEASDFIVHSKARGLPFETDRPHSLFDFREQIAGHDVPFVSHEMGQFCVFPDFEEIPKYGGTFRAKNLEMFQERFGEQFSAEKARAFLNASGKLQLLCYRAEVEAALRTPGLAGIQLLGANDFPGQGTALIGWLNAFYEPKPYVDTAAIRNWMGPVVLLVRTPTFVACSGEMMAWEIEVANFSEEDWLNAILEWELVRVDGQREERIETGSFVCQRIATGGVSFQGRVSHILSAVECAQQWEFRVRLRDVCNAWPLWVYPKPRACPLPANLEVAKAWDVSVHDALADGRDVLLLAGATIENGKDVAQYFRPAFWNTSWFQMSPPHTLGLCIDKDHPVFARFPTSDYSDYQWWELVQGQRVANLENFPSAMQPIVQPIDTWFINRRLALLFECRVGRSRVVVCTAALDPADASRPVAAELYQRIVDYMAGDSFDPQMEVEPSVMTELFERKERKGYDVMTDEKPDELIPKMSLEDGH